ncbi:MAG: PAS domain S-box protein [Steroidobacteraceae bacterium]
MADQVRASNGSSESLALDLNADPGELWRAIVEASPESIAIVAADGRLLQVNSAGRRSIGAASREAVAGTYMFDLVAPEHRAAWIEFHRRVCQGEHLIWQFDSIGRTGARRRMETNAVPIGICDGTVAQLAFTRDVTLRDRTEQGLQQVNEALEETVTDRTKELGTALQRLQESERSFALLVGSVTDYAIFMLDPAGRVLNWNPGARRIKGYEAHEIVGRHFSCFYTEEDRRADAPMTGLRLAAREGRLEKEGWRVRKDGSRFWANVIIDAVYDEGQLIGFAKITRDITERKAAEAQLRQAQKMEVVGQFTGGAAHDFSNLLMAISGSLELLRKRLPNDQRMLALLDNAVQASKRGISLTQRMLSFARRQELKLEAVDLAILVGGMKELLERSVGPAVHITARVPRQIARVSTDFNQLETALLNLALNARDAMPGGGAILISAQETRIGAGHPTGLSPGLYACLTVSDTGQGMDEATLARVTEPFFTTKAVGKGTGLGLSMVDGLAAQSGGKLMIHSGLGQGTAVELWLPSAGKEAIGCTAASSDTHAIAPPTRPLLVLVVDDDGLVLSSTCAMLEDLGHQVIDSDSAARALEIVDGGGAVDLVVTDQVMPDMTGMELAKAIMARRPDLPVILVTGYTEIPAGMSPLIPRLAKPFTQHDLAEAVAAAVRSIG